MKRLFKFISGAAAAAVTAILPAAVSCTGLGDDIRRSDTDGSTPVEIVPEGERHLYVSAVSFPEGYDWKRDPLFGKAKAEILMFRDGVQTLCIPAGAGYEAGYEADRHHISGGHLYTEKCIGGQTVILRDGQPFCRYEPEEILRGIVSDGRYVNTLGQHRSGTGFTLRTNGKTVQSWEKGSVTGGFSDYSYMESGALYRDDGRLCFSYFTDDGGKKRWFHVADGREKEVRGTENMTSVFDVRTVSGKSYAAGAEGRWSAPILVVEGSRHDLSRTLKGDPAGDYRIFCQDGTAFLAGTFNLPGDAHPGTAFWDESGLLKQFGGNLKAFRYDGDMTDRVTFYDGRPFSVDYEGEKLRLLDPRVLMTPQCSCLTDEGWILGLSSRDGSTPPVLWKQGECEPMEINGYITAVRWE